MKQINETGGQRRELWEENNKIIKIIFNGK